MRTSLPQQFGLSRTWPKTLKTGFRDKVHFTSLVETNVFAVTDKPLQEIRSRGWGGVNSSFQQQLIRNFTSKPVQWSKAGFLMTGSY